MEILCNILENVSLVARVATEVHDVALESDASLERNETTSYVPLYEIVYQASLYYINSYVPYRISTVLT